MAADTTTAARGEQPSGKGPALVVDHLTKRFGERTAFEDVSFSVAQGEVFGFLGPCSHQRQAPQASPVFP
jgi:ABC-2 type transport system ATP-binding protein